MTGYVSTRYYRAPEIMLTWQKYDVAGESHTVHYLYLHHSSQVTPSLPPSISSTIVNSLSLLFERALSLARVGGVAG